MHFLNNNVDVDSNKHAIHSELVTKVWWEQQRRRRVMYSNGFLWATKTVRKKERQGERERGEKKGPWSKEEKLLESVS